MITSSPRTSTPVAEAAELGMSLHIEPSCIALRFTRPDGVARRFEFKERTITPVHRAEAEQLGISPIAAANLAAMRTTLRRKRTRLARDAEGTLRRDGVPLADLDAVLLHAMKLDTKHEAYAVFDYWFVRVMSRLVGRLAPVSPTSC